jgi:hypothetical protein
MKKAEFRIQESEARMKATLFFCFLFFWLLGSDS